MQKFLAILIATSGIALMLVSAIYLGNAEVKQWFPLCLLVGFGLSFNGWKRYRESIATSYRRA